MILFFFFYPKSQRKAHNCAPARHNNPTHRTPAAAAEECTRAVTEVGRKNTKELQKFGETGG
jgi:hypothetical protein